MLSSIELIGEVDMIVVKCIYCSGCKQTIYSRAHHDMRTCKCGNCSVDGGFDHFRYLVNPELPVGTVLLKSVSLEATKGDLWWDWNLNENKFGVIEDDC